MITVDSGSPADLGAIGSLLDAAGLPRDGIGAVPTDWFVARRGDRVVGAVAVERHGGDGLLRSLVVDETHRGSGIGSGLAAAAEQHAAGSGLGALYLLTETAEPFFARRGWQRIGRDAAPAAITASVEWATACGVSAVPMTLPA